MERAVNPGEIVSCKSMNYLNKFQNLFIQLIFNYKQIHTANIRLLSSLPSHGHGNTFLFFDLHTSGIIHYFEGIFIQLN